MTYNITLSLDLSDISSGIKDLMEEINKIHKEFGSPEQISFYGRACILRLDTPYELNEKQKQDVTEIILEEFKKNLPKWKFHIESFEQVKNIKLKHE